MTASPEYALVHLMEWTEQDNHMVILKILQVDRERIQATDPGIV